MRKADLYPFLELALEAALRDTDWQPAQGEPESGGVPPRMVQVRAGARSVVLAIEASSAPREKQLRQPAVAPVRGSGQKASKTAIPVLFVPHVPQALAKELRQVGLNYFDLYGGACLRWPGLHLERLPQPDPVVPGARALLEAEEKGRSIEATGVFGTRPVLRHRVLRVLLSYPGRKWHQSEIAQEAGVDASSQVHDTVRLLQREGLADAEGAGPKKVVFLTRPGDLLEQWSRFWEDSWKQVVRQAGLFFALSSDPSEVMDDLLGAAASAGAGIGFTLAAGANLFRPLLRDDTVHAWVVGDVARLAQVTDLETVRRDPNVILLPARDKGLLYLSANERESLHLPEQDGPQPVSPVQLYLDMRAAGGRYAEQAATLREEVLGY
jgi:hypothetical protein